MKQEWKKLIYTNIPDTLLDFIPKDIKKYCPNFEALSFNERREFYVDLFTELCRFESGFNPKCIYKEDFNDAKGKPVISTGLFQVSVESLAGYKFYITQAELLDPETNIKAMITIASKWIIQDGCISSDKAPWSGLARYWSPFRTFARKQSIQQATLAAKYGGNQMSIYDQFYAAAKSEMGVAELPGISENKKIIEYHSYTSLKASSELTPWCSSFANYVVAKCGLKGTNSAAAISWMKWGKPLAKPVKGCIAVLKRKGGNHVAFVDHIDGDMLYLLGGNQGNQVGISAYPKDRLLGFRGV